MTRKVSSRPRVVLVNRCFVLNDDKRFLMVQRSAMDRHLSTKWEVPGGKLDEGQDLSRALEREVLEETGLLVEPATRLAYVESEVIATGPYKGLPYIVLFFIGRVIGGGVKLSSEHDNYRWVSYEEALTYDITPEVQKALIVLKDSFTTSPVH